MVCLTLLVKSERDLTPISRHLTTSVPFCEMPTHWTKVPAARALPKTKKRWTKYLASSFSPYLQMKTSMRHQVLGLIFLLNLQMKIHQRLSTSSTRHQLITISIHIKKRQAIKNVSLNSKTLQLKLQTAKKISITCTLHNCVLPDFCRKKLWCQ